MHFVTQFLIDPLATPVARVVFSLYASAVQRDRRYVAVTVAVLAVLLFGLTGGQL